jgi:hypothetical protein
MKKLEFNSISAVDDLCWPVEKLDISITSPVMLFFTDLKKVNPQVIDESISINLTRLLMLKAYVKLKLVVDSDYKFLGVVSIEDLDEQQMTARLSKPIKR